MDIKTGLVTTGLALVALATSATSFSGTETQINSRVSETLLTFNAINPANKALGDKAAGVLVFPVSRRAAPGSLVNLAKVRCR